MRFLGDLFRYAWMGIAAVIGLVFSIYGYLEWNTQKPSVWVLVIFCVFQCSGWLVAYIYREAPRSSSANGSFKRVRNVGPEIQRLVQKSDIIRIFASASETYWVEMRGLSDSIRKPLTIRILMRIDDTEERSRVISRIESKWKEDVGSKNITLEFGYYKFDKVMFRGWLFDRESAAIDWYSRVPGTANRGSKDLFYLDDFDCIRDISELFDKIFEESTSRMKS